MNFVIRRERQFVVPAQPHGDRLRKPRADCPRYARVRRINHVDLCGTRVGNDEVAILIDGYPIWIDNGYAQHNLRRAIAKPPRVFRNSAYIVHGKANKDVVRGVYRDAADGARTASRRASGYRGIASLKIL